MKYKKTRSDAYAPTMAYESDAGFDVYHCGDPVEIFPHTHKQIKLGIAIGIENDEVAIISERSGHAIRDGITTIGNIIDAGYTGEISAIIRTGAQKMIVNAGDKIAQIIVMKLGAREIVEVDELSVTQRGEKAHHSSGQ